MSNTFGRLFRVTTFGESHGPALGCVIDGCPAGLPLDTETIAAELRRRRPGAGGPATTRTEADEPEILSGVFEGRTLGTPIAILVRNRGHHSADYEELRDVYRPGHGDWTWEAKYGLRDHRGGGRSSARETLGRVAAGAVAKCFLRAQGVTIRAWTSAAAGVQAPGWGAGDSSTGEPEGFDWEEIERSPLRMPPGPAAQEALALIEDLQRKGDSAGCEISCAAWGLPPGLGEPVFDKLDARLAQAMLSLGAAKGIEFGAGFAAAAGRGSEQNDRPRPGPALPAGAASLTGATKPAEPGSPAGTADDSPGASRGREAPAEGGAGIDRSGAPEGSPPGCREDYGGGGETSPHILPPGVPSLIWENKAGGMLGGISTGMPLVFTVAFKPVPSVSLPQRTVDRRGQVRELEIRGRHDGCIAGRVVPVVEAMTALTLADFVLLQRGARL